MTQNDLLLLTVDEAAERLNISRGLLYPLVMADPPVVRSIKIGKRRLIPAAALTEYIETEMERQTR